MPDKLNHHILPRFYLTGFASDVDPTRVWEYQPGRSYLPGENSRQKYNPVLITLRKAGARLGEYACPKPDGTIDFNTYENALERLEKPADPVFRRIRNRESISDSDRDILVAYMVMMIQRVPARKETIKDVFPKVLEEQRQRITSGIEKEIAEADPTDESGIARLEAKLEICNQIVAEYRYGGMPREMELKSMVESQMARVVDKMRSMRWQFYVAPDDNRFVTSDNPVHTFKGGVGFSKSYSELTFPVSSRVALLGSFRNVRQGYLPAPTQLLKEINRRVIAASTCHVYSSRKERWVATVIEKELHRFSLTYAAPELQSPIEV